jgi:hypothetical protein
MSRISTYDPCIPNVLAGIAGIMAVTARGEKFIP